MNQEKHTGWCCTDCEENFYLPVRAMSVNDLMVYCPYCGEFSHTVANTIPKEEEN